MATSVLSGTGLAALAQSPSPEPEPPAATTADTSESVAPPPPLEVAVDCHSGPEVVTITNNRAKPILVKSVGSTYNRRAGEPYRVRKVLKPGKSVTYTFGIGKGPKRLSRSFIFDNESSREGVLVKTDKGRVKVRCSEGTNAPATRDTIQPPADIDEVVIGQPVDALDLLATLPVEPEFEAGYDRGLFRHWVDADGDGCDTRQEVLRAESLTPVTLGAGCRVESGAWFSAFDGDTLTNPASVDINHTVPLKEAWQSGAHRWSPLGREEFANDLRDDRTLQAVSSGANRLQGERDPGVWLPADRDVACRFVIDWVAIKATWGLSVNQMERDAIEATLLACPTRTVTIVPRLEREGPRALGS